ncbi:fatty acid desaturase family protein [Collimonas pratensis]|uniref:Fatty acid desaturase family protein n=1 Tax=Collimonas pratensis TaxID=279113 RepID=A0A127Q4N9_9BURK|nr:fatty acid desaturase family protein [Collimonas pratensis]AMP04946.1 fatty acid desaturase family protein [Collimonas pratensis]
MPGHMEKASAASYRNKYAAQARLLNSLNPFKSTWMIARQWLVIAAALALPAYAVAFLSGEDGLWAGLCELSAAGLLAVVVLFVLSGFVLACKQHALGVIMHDATHHRLFKNAMLNEIASNWLCAFPTGMVTSSYRRGHLPHHLFTNKPNDPYWVRLVADDNYSFPKPRRAFYRILLGDLCGLHLRSWWPVIRYWTGWAFVFDNREKMLSTSERIQFVAFWLCAAALVTVLEAWPCFLLLWLLPMFTLTLAFTRIRIIAEHDLAQNERELERTRHVDGSWLERLALAPLNINYHVAHHLFPAVPLYNLPKMHAILMKDEGFRAEASLWPRYFGRNRGLIDTMLE